MKTAVTYYSSKIHRYLGIFIGIQFFLWTIGGLYFSWTNIKEIRGEHLRKKQEVVSLNAKVVSFEKAITTIKASGDFIDLQKLQLVSVMGKPFYEIVVSNKSGESNTILADATTGELRKAFSKDEAAKIALDALVNKSEVKDVTLIAEENVGGHHEYREKPLPAYAVSFDKPADLTVYIAANTGKVESFRTNSWRVFDFLWMLHTMDFEGRDDINNYLLRGFSVLGILTILSGFLLFFITSPILSKRT